MSRIFNLPLNVKACYVTENNHFIFAALTKPTPWRNAQVCTFNDSLHYFCPPTIQSHLSSCQPASSLSTATLPKAIMQAKNRISKQLTNL